MSLQPSHIFTNQQPIKAPIRLALKTISVISRKILVLMGVLSLTEAFSKQPSFIPIDRLKDNIDIQLTDEDMPLYPFEEDIADFPEAPNVDEINPMVLASYYNTVADCYESLAKDYQESAQKAAQSLHKARFKVQQNVLRRPAIDKASYIKTDSLEKNYYTLMQHQGRTYVNYQEISDRSAKKADYYRNIARTYEKVHKDS